MVHALAMSSSAPSSPHGGGQYRTCCRLILSPMALAAVALLYIVTFIVFRDGNHPVDLVALRGRRPSARSSTLVDDETATAVRDREEVERWDPPPQRNSGRISYGESPRGPVRGGVEVFPLQPSRRPRKATVPLVPEVAEVEGVLTAWKMPQQYAQGGGEAIKGLYVMFHGCNHGHLDWFDLPEERTIVSYLVKSGYAVVAPASKNRITGCWKHHTAVDSDLDAVRGMLWRWYRDWSIPPSTPLFLFGASSGGYMATTLASSGGFQLCEKRTTYIQVSGAISQVSWGIPAAKYMASCPPLAFMPMPKSDTLDSEGDATAPKVFGNSDKIPAQVTNIAHYVRKGGGKPRMLVLPLGELSLYGAFFSDRIYEVSVAQSERLYSALLTANAVRCRSGRFTSSDKDCFLVRDPRDSPLALDTLVSTYAEFNSTVAAVPQLSERRSQAAPPLPTMRPSTKQQQQTLGGDKNGDSLPAPPALNMTLGAAAASAAASGGKEKPSMEPHHAKEVFRELLNVAWGGHELSADFVAVWERWLWNSCGNNCRPGAWR
ncbi:unnamed protein product [Pylaiella littoralis]